MLSARQEDTVTASQQTRCTVRRASMRTVAGRTPSPRPPSPPPQKDLEAFTPTPPTDPHTHRTVSITASHTPLSSVSTRAHHQTSSCYLSKHPSANTSRPLDQSHTHLHCMSTLPSSNTIFCLKHFCSFTIVPKYFYTSL